MKVTKRQLRQIIKEERARIVNEAPRTDGRGNADANRETIKDELYKDQVKNGKYEAKSI